MIELSVVTGTYNRLESLKRFVNSVRRSVGIFPYEIILVDGGSTDGTIEWCKTQGDVELIEQGALLGAVAAFNEGAKTARGRYVVLANDDVYFIDESLLRAYSFMETYIKTVGVGCFFQNRNGKDWHVEQMPAVAPDGTQCSAHYGQVCIVPKWLGDEVGWWGDYLHTYGGDNELSSRVWELGYICHPIECCCIADMMINDDLRSRNGGDPAELIRQGVTHPDSKAWRERWTRDGMCGARIAPKPVIKSPLAKRQRIMYMPLFEPNNNFQRLTKRGLRDELVKQGTVLQNDYVRFGKEILFDQANAFQPDLFLFQLQDAKYIDAPFMLELRGMHPDAVFVNWNGDFHPENLYDPAYLNLLKQFDLTGVVTTAIADVWDEAGIQWFYWQIGYEHSAAEPTDETPVHDVVYLGNCYNEKRKLLGEALRDIADRNGLNLGLYGNWPMGWSSGENLYDFDAGRRLYMNAKIAISTQQYENSHGFVSNRLFQSMAAGGALVLQERFEGMELLGLIDGEHLITWDGFEELEELLVHFLGEDKRRQQIADAGNRYVLDNHSFKTRLQELNDKLAERGLI